MTWKLTIFAAIARQHWQSDSRVPGTKIGRGAKVLIYLTESGAFYAVLQVLMCSRFRFKQLYHLKSLV